MSILNGVRRGGKMRAEWKIETVKPIFKKGKNNDVSSDVIIKK